jgi:uncharacterized phage protein (TIGR02218 family)
MTAFLQTELTTACLCWRLDRRDGVALGFTTHDRDLLVGSLLYRAAPGMLPSAVSVSDGLNADSVDVKGALTSDAITAADLKAGRWDGAGVTIFMTDWTAPDAERLHIVRGQLGEISLAGRGFQAELNGPTAVLDRPVVEQTSPTCRATLGDKRCRVDMAGRVRRARVVSVESDGRLKLDQAEPTANAFAFGRLRWISGANSGLSAQIRSSEMDLVTLREEPSFSIAAGDLVEISEGCDRRFDTCVARFANAANFRGEPHLPGIDLLTRYPGT